MNTGQTGGPVGVDINVTPVWRKGITGNGVVLSVLDDGKFITIATAVIHNGFAIDMR
jgi:hypothetical protein